MYFRNVKNKVETKQTTHVTVVLDREGSLRAPMPTPLFTPSRLSGAPRVSTTYAPVTSHIASSMRLADFMKNGDLGLSDSLGPRYYPKEPISSTLEPLDLLDSQCVLPSPMAPLEPPWPHLPPIDKNKKERKETGRGNHLRKPTGHDQQSGSAVSRQVQILSRYT